MARPDRHSGRSARCCHASMASGRMMSTPNGRVRAARPPSSPACHHLARRQARMAPSDSARNSDSPYAAERKKLVGKTSRYQPARDAVASSKSRRASWTSSTAATNRATLATTTAIAYRPGGSSNRVISPTQSDHHGEQREERRAGRVGCPVTTPRDVQVVERIPAAERLEDRIQTRAQATRRGWRRTSGWQRRRARRPPPGSPGSPGTRRGRPAPWRDPATRCGSGVRSDEVPPQWLDGRRHCWSPPVTRVVGLTSPAGHPAQCSQIAERRRGQRVRPPSTTGHTGP